MNHFYQVIRSGKSFVIHEYMFGVRSNNAANKPIADLNWHLSKIPPHFKPLAVLHVTDKAVYDASDYQTKTSDLNHGANAA